MTKYLFIKIKVGLSLLCLSFIVLITCGVIQGHLQHRVKLLYQNLSSLKKVALQTQKVASLKQVHEKEFVAFEKCAFEYSQNDQDLKYPASYTLDFGPLSTMNAHPDEKGVSMQEASFTMPCLRDQDVYKFIEQLTNQGPGIFHIHEVTITRISPLSEEILDMLAAGENKILFHARIKATWIHR